MLKSKFLIEYVSSEYMYIVDTGVSDRSVTNDVEAVLSYLSEHHGLGNRRLIYRDSQGEVDEIIRDNGVFKSFAPGHVGIILPCNV